MPLPVARLGAVAQRWWLRVRRWERSPASRGGGKCVRQIREGVVSRSSSVHAREQRVGFSWTTQTAALYAAAGHRIKAIVVPLDVRAVALDVRAVARVLVKLARISVLSASNSMQQFQAQDQWWLTK